jgi:diadenosine tetraphosphate (Ap4A) HIT family hydrolase
VTKTHVIEPYELSADAQAEFWRDAMNVARAVAAVANPVKMNYEIHGNTLPHLHLHLLPRFVGDPYGGGPIDARVTSFRRTERELDVLRRAVRGALTSGLRT